MQQNHFPVGWGVCPGCVDRCLPDTFGNPHHNGHGSTSGHCQRYPWSTLHEQARPLGQRPSAEKPSRGRFSLPKVIVPVGPVNAGGQHSGSDPAAGAAVASPGALVPERGLLAGLGGFALVGDGLEAAGSLGS